MPEAFQPVQLESQGAWAGDGEVHALLEACPDIEAQRFRDGEYLVREGAEDRTIFLVLKGAFVVEQASPAGGPPVILACVSCEGDAPVIVGEMVALGAPRRTASVRCVGSTWCLVLPAERLETLIQGYPGLTRVLCQQFTRRIQESNATLKEIQERSALLPERRILQDGEAFFREGDRADTLFQVAMGTVRVVGPQGTRLLGPDDLPQGLLGFSAYLASGLYRESAFAEGLCLVAAIPGTRREAVVRTYPALVLETIDAR